jgi:hypothetical protein
MEGDELESSGIPLAQAWAASPAVTARPRRRSDVEDENAVRFRRDIALTSSGARVGDSPSATCMPYVPSGKLRSFRKFGRFTLRVGLSDRVREREKPRVAS